MYDSGYFLSVLLSFDWPKSRYLIYIVKWSPQISGIHSSRCMEPMACKYIYQIIGPDYTCNRGYSAWFVGAC